MRRPPRRFPAGSHIRIYRKLLWHHAIYINDREVIHLTVGRGSKFKGGARVKQTTFEEFLDGQPASDCEVVKSYRAYGITFRYREGRDETAIRRARRAKGKSGYDVRENNCEHFATHCKTGVKRSSQVAAAERVLRGPTKRAGDDVFERLRRVSRATAGRLWATMLKSMEAVACAMDDRDLAGFCNDSATRVSEAMID